MALVEKVRKETPDSFSGIENIVPFLKRYPLFYK